MDRKRAHALAAAGVFHELFEHADLALDVLVLAPARCTGRQPAGRARDPIGVARFFRKPVLEEPGPEERALVVGIAMPPRYMAGTIIEKLGLGAGGSR